MGTRDTVRITGRTIRTVEQSARLAYERYWFDSGMPSPFGARHGWSNLEIVGDFAVEGPRSGPILLWDEVLGRSDDAVVLRERYFDGNIGTWEPAPPPIVRDATGLDPLPEEDFWHYIDLLGGRMWEKTLASAEAALAERDEPFILRWQETCALKQLALADTVGDIEQYGHDAFSVLGAAIGKGRVVYESLFPHWESWDPRWITDRSQSVPHLGGFALNRRMGASVRVTTSFTPLHNRLLVSAQAQRDASRRAFESREGKGRAEIEQDLGPTPSIEQITRYLEDHLAELSKEGSDAIFEMFQPVHFRGMDEKLTMRAVRALIDDGESIRMRIVLGNVAFHLDEDVLPAMHEALESFGGVVCSRIEADRGAYHGPLDADLFVVKRRFRGSRAEYLERFFPE